jgi:O-antigen/teichoic acid export membrane protein
MNLKRLIKNKEVKNAGWLIGGKIFQMVLSLFVGVLTARFLGPENYGVINYGAAFVALFSSVCTLGLNSVIIKDFVDNPDDQGVAIGSSILMRFLSSVASALMIVGISFVIDRDEPMTVLVVSLCSIGVIFQVFDTINYWFQAQYKYRSDRWVPGSGHSHPC